MGMSHLPDITKMFQQVRSANEPIAIIQHATCAEQKFAIGTVSTIMDEIREKGISSPAVIVIGKVVLERNAVELRTQLVKLNVAV